MKLLKLKNKKERNLLTPHNVKIENKILVTSIATNEDDFNF